MWSQHHQRQDRLKMRQLELMKDPGPKDVKVPAGSSQKKNVNFSLESVLQFRDDNLEHSAHKENEGMKPLGARPNYDQRKRQFWAIQQPERKQYLKMRELDIFVFLFFGGFHIMASPYPCPLVIQGSM